MGDVGETYKALKGEMKRDSSKRRHSNMCSSKRMLVDNNILFDDKGYHLIVKHNNHIVDFWPTTGKFNVRGTSKYLRGVRLLIKLVRGDYSTDEFNKITGLKNV